MKNKKDLLIAFFGTPVLAVRVLERLKANGITPALVVTSPDRPKGRGKIMTPPPVKEWALGAGIDVAQPITLKNGFADELHNTEWDLFIVAAYGKIIPKNILDIPRHGTLNVHPSLLPKFRGPSPILSALLVDERETGVSIMLLDEEMDHGPIVAQARVEIEKDDWPLKGSVLEALLADEGGNLLAEVIPPWVAGEIVPEPQDHSMATYTKKFEDADARVDMSDGAYANFLKIKTFDENPRAYMLAEKNGKSMRVIITDADYKDGTLQITRVIPEGKKEMAYEDFLRGLQN